jgi:dihydrodipicolinate synthase/N-acetylneuraminate lyase
MDRTTAPTTDRPGLIVAPLTPFTADLHVDDNALRRQIDYVVTDCGATMVVAAGVETQEYTYLGVDERKALIRRTIELVDRGRAGARCRKARRRRGAAARAAAPICRAADPGRPDRLF